jgi:superfamily II DNA/RNA helicase
MDQMSRMATLDAFRDGRITLLAASAVAARGLDIPDVSHIFNFDVPWQADDYVHRIGRTGRAGKEGRSLTIVTLDDIKQLKDIERMLGAPVTWLGAPPSEEDLTEGSRKRRGRGGAARRASPGREARRGSEAAPRPASGRGARRPGRAPRTDRGADRVPERRKAATSAGADAGAADRLREEQATPRPAAKSSRPAGAGKPQRQRPERKPPRQPWEPREPQRRDREDRTPTPVGLGDHVPAFLRRPTRPASH